MLQESWQLMRNRILFVSGRNPEEIFRKEKIRAKIVKRDHDKKIDE